MWWLNDGDGIVDAQNDATIRGNTLFPPERARELKITFSTATESTLHTASLRRGAARNMSSTLQVKR